MSNIFPNSHLIQKCVQNQQLFQNNCWLCIHFWIKWELGKTFDSKMKGWIFNISTNVWSFLFYQNFTKIWRGKINPLNLFFRRPPREETDHLSWKTSFCHQLLKIRKEFLSGLLSTLENLLRIFICFFFSLFSVLISWKKYWAVQNGEKTAWFTSKNHEQ